MKKRCFYDKLAYFTFCQKKVTQTFPKLSARLKFFTEGIFYRFIARAFRAVDADSLPRFVKMHVLVCGVKVVGRGSGGPVSAGGMIHLVPPALLKTTTRRAKNKSPLHGEYLHVKIVEWIGNLVNAC